MNHRHMTDDHHGRTAGRATLLVRAADEILGTHRAAGCYCAAAIHATGKRGIIGRSH